MFTQLYIHSTDMNDPFNYVKWQWYIDPSLKSITGTDTVHNRDRNLAALFKSLVLDTVAPLFYTHIVCIQFLLWQYCYMHGTPDKTIKPTETKQSVGLLNQQSEYLLEFPVLISSQTHSYNLWAHVTQYINLFSSDY